MIKRPYLLFLGDARDELAAKTAHGIVDWRADWCVGQLRLKNCKADTGLPDLTIAQAREKGAETLVIGAVNAGGILPESWIKPIVEAISAGMDIASGLHVRLTRVPQIHQAAKSHAVRLHDVRHSDQEFATGSGNKRNGRRLLTVGTDCSVGKKYTTLYLERSMKNRNMDADFKATGQTGILISNRGVAVDSVKSDFISGAVEWLSPEADPNHWDLIEGQGSIFHPSFAGVSLGLLHGAQPDAIVLCHEPTRTHMRGVLHPIPSISDVLDVNLRLGRLTNPAIRPVGLAVNTASISASEAGDLLADLEQDFDLPACDPMRFGVEAIVDRLEREFG